jgi:hypothetical protein
MKNAVFWDVVPCRSCVNRLFGGTYHLHLQDRKIRVRGPSVNRWLQSADEGDTFLRNVGSHEIYTAPHPRRRHYPNVHNLFSSVRRPPYSIHIVTLANLPGHVTKMQRLIR